MSLYESGDIMEQENYFFDSENETKKDLVFVLVIYDIVDNKKRVRLSKYLEGFGNRIQKSAFEARISRKSYEKLIREIPAFVTEEDSVRVYKIIGNGQVTSWGMKQDMEEEEIILI